jgi:transcriptional regulator with XRE-family HTH domain
MSNANKSAPAILVLLVRNMSDVIDVQVLRALREAKGWDQLTLARAAGIDPSVISRLERGTQLDLRASVLVGIARALHTSVDSLLVPLQQQPPAVALELASVIAELDQLPEAYQRHVAALLRAYLTALPE